MEKVINIGGRLHNPVVGGAVTGANEIKDDTRGKMQNVINTETDAELVRLDEAKQEKLTFDQTPTENSTNPVTSGGVYAADAALQQAIEAILLLIPSAASALNQLADKAFVNSSISTATATFRGTYNLVTDLGLTVSATHAQIATALASEVSTADNNDYCFVQVPVSDQSQLIRVTERYKFNGTAWSYEYDLNNSGFTADQWAAINSGITSVLVGKLGALPTAAELATMFAGKQNTLTFDTTPVNGSANPVTSGGLYAKFAAIEAMTPSDADANNKLVAENRLAAYVATVIGALDVSYNITSADGHVTFKLTQADGAITSVQILTDDIASAAALTTLGGRVSTAESDIDVLQDAYAALTQSDVVIVEGALPSSGQQQNIIYRQPDQDHTPPQYYSDYMWNGTTWVLMAMYMNGVDPRPKKGSQNLVTSGGVFDNMGALDVSELNATENPHTLAIYADLSAALAAIPSDYQKGGMSIKFVCSSDNKYVQYRLTADDWSTDTDDWVIANEGIYVENPEFVYVKTDAEGKILWAIKTDGGIYYGAGCPKQVKDYIEDKISSLSLDEYEDIVTFLSDYLGSDTTLKTIIDGINATKLDAEGLDPDALGTVQTIENPEWLHVTTDAEGRVLEGIRLNGSKYIAPSNNLFGDYNVPNFKYGDIDYSGGFISDEDYIRNINLIKIKAGTVLVPYVFGRYKIAFYDEYDNFIKVLPEEGGGQHNTGWFEQYAYEFTEDCNVRFVLGWMSSANFYLQSGYENIIPNDNVINNILCKFRLVNDDNELPYYITHAIDNIQSEVLSNKGMFTFTYITDPHEYFYHEDAAVYCANKTSRMLINGGDLLSWPETGISPAINTLSRHVNSLLKSTVPVIMSRGNHEMSETYDSEGNVYNRDIWYNQAQLPFRKDNFVYNENDSNGGYFYVDDELYKVRVICLNMHINVGGHGVTDKQRRWLSTVALDLSSKGNDESNWVVIAFGHCQILDNIDPIETTATRDERWIADMFKAAYNKTAPVFINPESDDRYDVWCDLIPSINIDFSSIQYQFIGYIHGHCHYDNVSTEKDFVHITTTCAHPLENEDHYRRDFNTEREYAFDVISIDKENRKLLLKRIGVGSDREISY